MLNELKTKEDAWIQFIHNSIDRLSIRIGNITKDDTSILNGEEYLCDKEVSQLLKVSRRTLSDYRSNGTLSHAMFSAAKSCTKEAR